MTQTMPQLGGRNRSAESKASVPSVQSGRGEAKTLPPRETGGDVGVDHPEQDDRENSVDSTTPAVAASQLPSDDETPVTRSGLTAVFRTTVVCASAAAIGHLVLLLGWLGHDPAEPSNLLPWQPVVGASLSLVAVVSFGGFYYAALRVRVAIMSSFLLTFLLLLTYVLTVTELSGESDSAMVTTLLDDFRVIVQTIIGFYFGTETVLSLTKILRAPRGNAAAIRRADRDLPAG